MIRVVRKRRPARQCTSADMVQSVAHGRTNRGQRRRGACTSDLRPEETFVPISFHLGFRLSKETVTASLGVPLETGDGRGSSPLTEEAGSLHTPNGPGKQGTVHRLLPSPFSLPRSAVIISCLALRSALSWMHILSNHDRLAFSMFRCHLSMLVGKRSSAAMASTHSSTLIFRESRPRLLRYIGSNASPWCPHILRHARRRRGAGRSALGNVM